MYEDHTELGHIKRIFIGHNLLKEYTTFHQRIDSRPKYNASSMVLMGLNGYDFLVRDTLAILTQNHSNR